MSISSQDILIFTGRLITAEVFFIAVMISFFKFFKEKPLNMVKYYFWGQSFFFIFEFLFIFLAQNYYAKIEWFIDFFKIEDNFFTNPFLYLNRAIFLGMFFIEIIDNKSKVLKTFLQLYLIFIILNLFFGEGYHQHQPIGSILDDIFLIITSIYFIKYYFLNLKNNKKTKSIFLFSCSLLIIGVVNLILNLFTKSLFNDNNELFSYLYVINNFIRIACYALILYAFLKLRKRIN